MFLTLGRRLGLRPLLETARAFGLGQTTGLDLPAERSGLLPTPEWKKAANGEPWFPGDTLQLAIGQGGLLVTPLQVAVQAAAIANGGSLVTPHLLLSPRRPASSPPRPSLGLSPQDLSLLRQAMTRVVAPGGTAASIYMPGLAVAGKTGTAENPAGAPHSWFVGFAPADDPKIVVAVLVEHGGPDHAAPPIARKLLLAAGRNGYFKLPPRYQQDSSSPAHSPKPAAVAARP
jgi:penicillin-binding protein 2